MLIDFTDSSVLEELKTNGYLSASEAEELSNKRNSALEANKNSILDQLKEQKATYEGIDAEQYKKLAEDKRFEIIRTGGFDAYEQSLGGELQGRLSALQSDMMIKEQDWLRGKETLESQVETLNKSLSHSELKRKLGMALVKNDLVDPLAVPEIERDALDQLGLDDKGNIIVAGEDGIPRQTADGPMREDEWLKEMMKEKPYRFRGADGSGRRPTPGALSTEGMSPKEKRAAARRART